MRKKIMPPADNLLFYGDNLDVMQLDLIITVDTSVAHLASGAVYRRVSSARATSSSHPSRSGTPPLLRAAIVLTSQSTLDKQATGANTYDPHQQ